MPIQADEPKPNTGKLVAAGILIAVTMVVLSMPQALRAIFVAIALLAAVAGAWLAWH